MKSKAEEIAKKWHNDCNHKYDGKPYGVHLELTVDVAKRFSYLIPDNYLDIVFSACWLHDTIEDTRHNYNDIRNEFNTAVADLVFAVTNEKGKSRYDRANNKYYQGIRDVEFATFVKLCDRIANIEYSKDNVGLLNMYKKEHSYFTQQLYSAKYKDMFDYINSIL